MLVSVWILIVAVMIMLVLMLLLMVLICVLVCYVVVGNIAAVAIDGYVNADDVDDVDVDVDR